MQQQQKLQHKLWQYCAMMSSNTLHCFIVKHVDLFNNMRARHEPQVNFDKAHITSTSEVAMKAWLFSQSVYFQEWFYEVLLNHYKHMEQQQQQQQQRKTSGNSSSAAASSSSSPQQACSPPADNTIDQNVDNDNSDIDMNGDNQEQEEEIENNGKKNSAHMEQDDDEDEEEDNPENYIILDYYLMSQGEYKDIVCICSRDLRQQIDDDRVYKNLYKNLKTEARVRVMDYKEELDKKLGFEGNYGFCVWRYLKEHLIQRNYTPLLGKLKGTFEL